MVCDNQDIARQMTMLYLYARVNAIVSLAKCIRDVKLCLFRAYCTQFCGPELWECFQFSHLIVTTF